MLWDLVRSGAKITKHNDLDRGSHCILALYTAAGVLVVVNHCFTSFLGINGLLGDIVIR